MMSRWSTAFTQYSGTCLLQSLMGHKYLALLERWLEYTGPLHSSHVKLWCLVLLYKFIRKESMQWKYSACHLQRCYRSQGCLSIINAVVKATFSSKERAWQGKERLRLKQESTPLRITDGVLLVHVKHISIFQVL